MRKTAAGNQILVLSERIPLFAWSQIDCMKLAVGLAHGASVPKGSATPEFCVRFPWA